MSTDMERAFYASDPRLGRPLRGGGAHDRHLLPARRAASASRCRRTSSTCPTPPPRVRPDTERACAASPRTARPVTLRTIQTPIGPMLAGATDAAIVLCDFADRRMIGAQLAAVRRRIGPTREGNSPLLDRLESQLDEYFAGTRRDFDLPIDIPGSAFQERVWDELRRIPYGETISYRELAERVGAGAAYRAVGRANGSNRVAIVVPCHRVIAAGGGLGGYGGGLPAKRSAARARASLRVVREVDLQHLVGPLQGREAACRFLDRQGQPRQPAEQQLATQRHLDGPGAQELPTDMLGWTLPIWPHTMRMPLWWNSSPSTRPRLALVEAHRHDGAPAATVRIASCSARVSAGALPGHGDALGAMRPLERRRDVDVPSDASMPSRGRAPARSPGAPGSRSTT